MRPTRLLTAAVASAALLALLPAAAAADIFVSPFLGVKFKGATNELAFGNGADNVKLSLGLSGIVLADKGVGIETEFGYNPRFFDGGELGTRSGVTTLFGNVVAALPLNVTRESLRPYAIGGLGWIHASANDLIGFGRFSNDFLGLAVGGGAIGFVTATTGLRFDLRYMKAISSGDISSLPDQGSARISFWRATVGVVFR